MKIKVDTYTYGTKYTTRYLDLDNFESCVFMNEGYFVTGDGELINSKEIKMAMEIAEDDA